MPREVDRFCFGLYDAPERHNRKLHHGHFEDDNLSGCSTASGHSNSKILLEERLFGNGTMQRSDPSMGKIHSDLLEEV